jgi:hypothetical protein
MLLTLLTLLNSLSNNSLLPLLINLSGCAVVTSVTAFHDFALYISYSMLLLNFRYFTLSLVRSLITICCSTELGTHADAILFLTVVGSCGSHTDIVWFIVPAFYQ